MVDEIFLINIHTTYILEIVESNPGNCGNPGKEDKTENNAETEKNLFDTLGE